SSPWSFIGRDHPVEVPAIVGALAAAVGMILQGVAGTAKDVFITGGVPHVETRLTANGDLLDLQRRDVLGEKRGRITCIGNQAVAHSDSAERVPGRGSPRVLGGVDIGADRAHGERPALPDAT